ncbi:MAG: exosome complex RNA-binding protein Csl4 [Methanomassiliicoccales archaeon]
MIEKRSVVPGEEVGVVEEYMPGIGTWEDEDGKIHAALLGELQIDNEEKVVTVTAQKPMTLLVPGDLVFCQVTDVRSAMAICEVVAVEGKGREVTGDTNGTIHVSKLSQEYVQEVGKEVRPSDIIRARVTQVKPSVQLTTASEHLGVIKALCRKCRQPLVKVEKGLYCATCDRQDYRKMADDYGDVNY